MEGRFFLFYVIDYIWQDSAAFCDSEGKFAT